MFQSTRADASVDPCVRRQRMTVLLQDTIVMLCKNMIKYDFELSVEGLLGVTVDKKDVVLINIKELVCDETRPSVIGDDAEEEVGSKRFKPTLQQFSVDKISRPMIKSKSFKRGEKIKGERNDQMKFIGNESTNALNVNEANDVTIECGLVQQDFAALTSSQLDIKAEGSLSDAIPRKKSENVKSKQDSRASIRAGTCKGSPGRSANARKRPNEHTEVTWGAIKTEPLDVNLTNLSHKTSNNGVSVDELNSMQSTTWQNDDLAIDPRAQPSGSGGGETDCLETVCNIERDSNGVIVYRCRQCATPFCAKHHLRRHYNSKHSFAPEQYFCRTCGAGFRRLDVMRRHSKNVHHETDSDAIGLSNTDLEQIGQDYDQLVIFE